MSTDLFKVEAKKPKASDFKTRRYWRQRSDLLYYQYFRMIMRCIAADAGRVIDVGTGNAPYLEWFPWIGERCSIDIIAPYTSAVVRGIRGDIFTEPLTLPYDVCTCMQVLEHVEDAQRFARRLLEMGSLVLVSVPYKWPASASVHHVHDPVDEAKLEEWFGRAPNWSLVVQEPFLGATGRRMFALFDTVDPQRRFGVETWRGRVPEDAMGGAE